MKNRKKSTVDGPSTAWRVLVAALAALLVAAAVCSCIVTVERNTASDRSESADAGQASLQGSSPAGDDSASAQTGTSAPTGTSAQSEEQNPSSNASPGGSPSPSQTQTSATDWKSSRIVCIDPGHQDSEDASTEPIGPGSATMKAKMTLGTHGTTTGLTEYDLNLAVSRLLKTELESRGYTVYLTRESNDVNLSNIDRARYATSVNAGIYIRVHANGVDAASADGAMMLAPSLSNPYLSREIVDSSRLLAQDIIDAYCAATGMRNRGVADSDDMTGMNWATMPVTLIELGFMTNPTDDTNMADPDFQATMARGIADGVDVYFAG